MRPAAAQGHSRLAARLRHELEGEVLFDAYSRGRYSTDASIYQIEPIGVVVPRHSADIVAALQIAAEEGVTVLPRGGGTSQIGQTTGESLVVDVSKYMNRVLAFDAAARTVTVEPGLVLEPLNKFLKPHGLFYPVDVSTGNRATLGGMAGNNSCGSRSIRYGNMVHNVRTIDALLADGSEHRFAEVAADLSGLDADARYAQIVRRLRTLGEREAGEIARRFPKLLRRVGGYNIDTLKSGGHNMAQLLVGSEGTLAFFTRLELKLQPIPPHKVLGICHFPSFYQAMDATQHVVKLDPSAVELVDRTMIDLSRDIAMFRVTIERCVRGQPDALLLVEFAGEDHDAQLQQLRRLDELMGELGFPDAVVEAIDPKFQSAVWEVRKAGLNIMMSMKGDGKPVSFIEDCAVPLEDLAEYTDRLTKVFHKHGTTGTWYAHASVGCLHVRPILNMKDEQGAKKMRAIAEEAFAMVREYKGSHSGEHGDGIARSEFHESMFGAQIVRAFEEVKDVFDPTGLFNPGKIVRPERMDDRRLFRYKPEYQPQSFETVLDWSAWGGFAGAVEMCNNNGACRKAEPGVMCPSYRATRDEQHVTRGRANTLRLAISGQLGRDALVSAAMRETMALCVSCKGCKRECPTGVDMARMKIEFMHQYRKRHAPRLRERLIAWLPRYAPLAARLPWLFNLRDRIPGVAWLSERLLGLSAARELPQWRADFFGSRADDTASADGAAGEVVLWVDTFNTWFEPENARAALAVLQAAGYRVHLARPLDGGRPLCCGRTF
ncbi:MAG: lactate dehydrogenase, partial [Proteobacteria bacterium]|nr:lactate dehydrogenase [Pseudomonadota bacterium]